MPTNGEISIIETSGDPPSKVLTLPKGRQSVSINLSYYGIDPQRDRAACFPIFSEFGFCIIYWVTTTYTHTVLSGPFSRGNRKLFSCSTSKIARLEVTRLLRAEQSAAHVRLHRPGESLGHLARAGDRLVFPRARPTGGVPSRRLLTVEHVPIVGLRGRVLETSFPHRGTVSTLEVTRDERCLPSGAYHMYWTGTALMV